MKENSIEEAVKTMEHWVEYEKNNKDKINKADELIYIQEIILSDYKRVLEINEVLLKENEELKIKNHAIKRESEAYAEHMIRLDNELNLEKEKSKYEWIRQNCLSQELVNKLYIPIQKVKDKIKELDKRIKNPEKISYWASYTISECVGIRRSLQELLKGGK